jgi:hypothetical protein
VNQLVTPRWQRRAFAPVFDDINHLMPAEYVIAHETYILSEASSAAVKICDSGIDVKILEDVRQGLELWRPILAAPFPLCHRAVREVCKALAAPHPLTLFLAEYRAPEFVADIACCLPGVRVIGVHKSRRHALVDECIVERAAVSMAGQTIQSAAVESVDPEAALRLISRLHLDRFENVNDVEYLKRLLGMRTFARAS